MTAKEPFEVAGKASLTERNPLFYVNQSTAKIIEVVTDYASLPRIGAKIHGERVVF